MKWRYLSFLILIGFIISGCAGAELAGGSPGSKVGQTEADLLALEGKPQKILAGPEGGKIFVYTRGRMDQTAILSGGAWSKQEETYYFLDPQGKIYKEKNYPYGKHKFLFPAEEPASPQVAQVQPPAAPRTSAAAAETPAQSPAPSQAPVGKRAEPTAPSSPGREASSRLEPGMSKAQVRGLLGLPDRSEGFHLQGKPVIVWFYSLEGGQERKVATPLVFIDNRLNGWGDAYYRRVLQGMRPELPK